jgi:hypothetical protein
VYRSNQRRRGIVPIAPAEGNQPITHEDIVAAARKAKGLSQTAGRVYAHAAQKASAAEDAREQAKLNLKGAKKAFKAARKAARQAARDAEAARKAFKKATARSDEAEARVAATTKGARSTKRATATKTATATKKAVSTKKAGLRTMTAASAPKKRVPRSSAALRKARAARTAMPKEQVVTSAAPVAEANVVEADSFVLGESRSEPQ